MSNFYPLRVQFYLTTSKELFSFVSPHIKVDEYSYLKATFDKTEVMIGEPVNIELEYKNKPYPEPALDVIGWFKEKGQIVFHDDVEYSISKESDTVYKAVIIPDSEGVLRFDIKGAELTGTPISYDYRGFFIRVKR